MNFDHIYLICTRLERHRNALVVLGATPPPTLDPDEQREWRKAVGTLTDLADVLEGQLNGVKEQFPK